MRRIVTGSGWSKRFYEDIGIEQLATFYFYSPLMCRNVVFLAPTEPDFDSRETPYRAALNGVEVSEPLH